MNATTTALAGLLVRWLLDYYLAATLLLIVAWLGWRWVRQPAHRITAAWTVMLELIVLAVVCALPFWPRVSLIPVPEASQESVADSPVVISYKPREMAPIWMPPHIEKNPVVVAPMKPEVPEPVALPVPPKTPLTWSEWIVLGYFAGISLITLWLCWGAASAAWVCKRARPADDSLKAELLEIVQRTATDSSGTGPFFGEKGSYAYEPSAENMDLSPSTARTPRLLVSPRIVNAVAMGVFTPTIVLPAKLAEGGPSQTLRAVLSHEWAHLHHRDLWLLALGRCLLAVFFAHPLFWWLRRAIRNDQELLADAAAAGDNRHDYAEELIRLIRKTTQPSPMAFSAAMGIWEGSSQLTRRISMLLDDTFRVQPTGSRRWKYRAFGLIVLLGAACSLLSLQPSRSAADQSKSENAAESKSVEKADPNGEGFLKPGSDVTIGSEGDRFICDSNAKWTQGSKIFSDGSQISSESGAIVFTSHGESCFHLDTGWSEKTLALKKDFYPGPFTKSSNGTLVLVKTDDSEPRVSASATIVNSKPIDKKPADDKEPSHGTATLSVENTYVGETTVENNLDMENEYVYLPGFQIALQAEDLKDLKISDKQKKQLREIQDNFNKESQKFFEERKGKDQAAVEKEFRKKYLENLKSSRKLVEKILTPDQLKTLERMKFREGVLVIFYSPEVLKKPGVDKEQQSKLDSIKKEYSEIAKKDDKEKNDAMMAVLNAQQRGKIREAALGTLGQEVWHNQYVQIEGQSKPISMPTLYPYPDFSDESVQKDLGLSKEQQSQVRDILGGSPTLKDRMWEELKKTRGVKDGKIKSADVNFSGGVLTVAGSATVTFANDSGKKLSPEEIKKQKAEAEKRRAAMVAQMKKEREKARAEHEKQPLVKLIAELRKKFEAALTPEQLESYRDMAFRQVFNMGLTDPVIQDEIGLSSEQCGALQQLALKSIEKYRKIGHEMGEKALKVLTPAQQEKLQKVLDEMESMPLAADNGEETGVGSVTVIGDVAVEGAEAGVGSVTVEGNVIEMKGTLRGDSGAFTARGNRDITGTVLSPDGSPASGASVALCTKSKDVTVQGGKLHWREGGKNLKLAETTKDGSFHIHTDAEPGVIVAANDKGYAETTAAEFAKNSSKVRLKPWGRVEGQFVVNGKPLPGCLIDAGAGRRDVEGSLIYNDSATSDAAGKFTIERVPPVRLYIKPSIIREDGASYSPFWYSGDTTIAPGKTTRILLPREGRPVIGRIVSPPKSGLRLADLSLQANVFPRPPHISGIQEEVQKSFAVYGDFMKSEYGKAFFRDKIAVNADGTFRIEGLPETDYVIQVTATGEGLKAGAFVSRRVTVPPLSESKEPLDVGELVLREEANDK